MFEEYESTAGGNSYAVKLIKPSCTIHYMRIILSNSNDTNEWHPFVSYSYKINDRPLGPKHLASFKHGIDVEHSGRTMAARRKEHQTDNSAVWERNISTDHGINVSGNTEHHYAWTAS